MAQKGQKERQIFNSHGGRSWAWRTRVGAIGAERHVGCVRVRHLLLAHSMFSTLFGFKALTNDPFFGEIKESQFSPKFDLNMVPKLV